MKSFTDSDQRRYDGSRAHRGLDKLIGAANQEDVQENSAAAGAPTISGTARAGETLTASTTDIRRLANASFTYHWLAATLKSAAQRGAATPWLPQTRARPSRFRCPSQTMRGTRSR